MSAFETAITKLNDAAKNLQPVQLSAEEVLAVMWERYTLERRIEMLEDQPSPVLWQKVTSIVEPDIQP